ncbi:Peripla_BP_6 domain-containing protein [Gammaproteobacteria bacterium]
MIVTIRRLFAKLAELSKPKLFWVILLATGLIATIATLLVNVLVLDNTKVPPLRLALVAPLSGEETALGRAIREGVELKIADVNRAGGIGGRKISVVTFDDGNQPDRARTAAAEAVASGAIAVIGHTNLSTLTSAEPVYADHKLGVITLAADQTQRSASDRSAGSRLLVAEDYEIRFLANYVRNVVGEKTVHILYEDSSRGEALANAFDETMQRFGTKVLYRWALTPGSPTATAQVVAAARQLTEGKLPGTILIIADPAASAHAVVGLRMNGVRNPIAGTRSFATDSFAETLKKEWSGATSVESALNGSLLTVPMLFDVAGETAQNFRTEFITKFKHAPDWIAAYANDAAQVMVNGLQSGSSAGNRTDDALRAQLFQQLSEAQSLSPTSPQAVRMANDGVSGPILLNARGRDIRPPLIGTYDGIDLISTMTQLVPIREEGIGNLLQQFIEGRALYVNDRFMYRTNVVYTGIQPANITSFNEKERTVEGEFLIWFRWRGDFEPQDIVFTNAATPIQLKEPEHEEKTKDITYRIYRVEGKFFMNFSGTPRAFDTELIGITFHHRLLSRHNLMYVTDVLGMGMTRNTTLQGILKEANTTGATIKEKEGGILDVLVQQLRSVGRFLYSDSNLSDPLIDLISHTNVLAGAPGWVIDKAWISQDITPRSSQGDPNYVGFGRPVPDFSKVELGIILKPDLIRARDIIPSQYFWYLAIFSGLGSLLAFALDKKHGKQFWRVQTFVLRLIFWPLLLISLGNLALDDALRYATPGVVSNIWTIYSIINWLMPALLLVIAVDRFIWMSLERRTQRKIPDIVRLLTASVIFLFALFGIVANVFNQTLTSLLATTGLSAMIIGLAIKANIANVFSGIILNIEKPFTIGDKIMFTVYRGKEIKGKVLDITWRTTRIEHELGHIVSVPNGKISETEIHNLSVTGSGFLCDLLVYVDPQWNQEQIMPLLKLAITDNPHIMNRAGVPPFSVVLLGLRNVGDSWRALYRVRIYVKGSPDGKPVCTKAGDLFWKRLLKNFQEAGLTWNQPPLLVTDKNCDSRADPKN